MIYIPIELDKTRNLLLGFQGLQLFKKITGKSLAKLDYENEDMEDYMPAIIHCALIHEDKELTLEKTTELIDKHIGVKGAIEVLQPLMEETYGKEADEKDRAKNLQRAAKKK
jgi:hypothetical protein